jgi:hypothetical protein
MHTGVKLLQVSMLQTKHGLDYAHHYCLALVLEDVAGPTDLISASQAQKHQLISWVDGFHILRLHGRVLPLRRHFYVMF